MRETTSKTLVLACCWLMYLAGAVLAWNALVAPRATIPQPSPALQALAFDEGSDPYARPVASCTEHPIIAVTLVPTAPDDDEPGWQHSLALDLATELARALPGSRPQIKTLHAPPVACAGTTCSTSDQSTLGDLAWHLQLAGLTSPKRAVSVVLLLQPAPNSTVPALEVLGPSGDGDLFLIGRGRGGSMPGLAAEAVAHWMGRRKAGELARWCRHGAARTLTGLMAAASLRGPSPALAEALREADGSLSAREQTHDGAVERIAELAEHPDLLMRPVFPLQHAAAVVMPLALPLGLVLARHTGRAVRDRWAHSSARAVK